MGRSRLSHVTYRTARRVAVAALGVTLLGLGVLLLVLPGPGLLLLGLGLAVLAAEFAWIRRWLRRIRNAADDAIHTHAAGGRNDASTPTRSPDRVR